MNLSKDKLSNKYTVYAGKETMNFANNFECSFHRLFLPNLDLNYNKLTLA